MSNATFQQVAGAVGLVVANAQAKTTYQPTVRGTRSSDDAYKLAMSNDLCWVLTDSPKIEFKKERKRWMYSILKRAKPNSKTGKRRYGAAKTEREAMQKMHEFRLSCEPKAVRDRVNERLDSLLGLSGDSSSGMSSSSSSGMSSDSSPNKERDDASVSTQSTAPMSDDSESDPEPWSARKRSPYYKDMRAKKRQEMSMCYEARSTSSNMRNPNSNGRFNPNGTDDLTCISPSSDTLAERYEAAANLRRFLLGKTFSRSEVVKKGSTICRLHINDLRAKVKKQKWEELVPFGTDKEIQ